MAIKFKNIFLILFTTLLIVAVINTGTSYAANNVMYGNRGTILYGSGYWTTSNLREWLNSDSQQVQYTSNPPDYQYEAGFLNEFSSTEKNGIAITEKRSYLSGLYTSAKDGGSVSMPHLNFYSDNFSGSDGPRKIMSFDNNIAYKNDIDKVFLLNPTDAYNYIIRRGKNFTKYLTAQAKTKNNTSANNYNWWIQGSTTWQDCDLAHSTSGSFKFNRPNPSTNLGVVPALNLKNDYILSNGIAAKDLKIGDEVIFGSYLKSPITWEVINISDNGNPMLLSKHVLDLKKLDNSGDVVKSNSDVLTFSSIDVSYSNSPQYKPQDMSSDTEAPIIKILNKDELYKRQNGPYTLEFQVIDNLSGIKYIQKPDGSKITTSRFSYTFTKNTNYSIKTMDIAGNYSDLVIPISNINDRPFVSITPSTTEWTNKNVFVDIQSSNEVTSFLNDTIVGKGHSIESSFDTFPNYTSYVGKKFKITGKIKLLNYNESAASQSAGIGFVYYSTHYDGDDVYITGSWSTPYKIPMSELINSSSNEIDFSTELTIPSNYAYGLRPYITSGVSSLNPNATLEYKNLKYQLIDDTDFSITGIKLPNGDIIHNNIYRDELSKEGINSYSYFVLDNSNINTNKIITTKIDKSMPIATIKKSTDSWTNKSVTLTINAEDNLSGVKRIMLPNGNWINSNSAHYTVSNNSSYKFIVEDNAGNQLSISENVTNIDKNFSGKPIITTNSNWTNSKNLEVVISVDDDSISGNKKLLYKLSGATISGWLEYSAPITISNEDITVVESKAIDNANNESDITSQKVYIDRTAPMNNDLIIHK